MCSNPISPYDNAYPSYLWPQVVAVLEAQGLPYLPSMAPIFAPNDPFAAFHYSDGRHSLIPKSKQLTPTPKSNI